MERFAALIANDVNQPITLECNHRRIDRGAPNQLRVRPARGDYLQRQTVG
jgi:hypothetical protein